MRELTSTHYKFAAISKTDATPRSRSLSAGNPNIREVLKHTQGCCILLSDRKSNWEIRVKSLKEIDTMIRYHGLLSILRRLPDEQSRIEFCICQQLQDSITVVIRETCRLINGICSQPEVYQKRSAFASLPKRVIKLLIENLTRPQAIAQYSYHCTKDMLLRFKSVDLIPLIIKFSNNKINQINVIRYCMQCLGTLLRSESCKLNPHWVTVKSHIIKQIHLLKSNEDTKNIGQYLLESFAKKWPDDAKTM